MASLKPHEFNMWWDLEAISVTWQRSGSFGSSGLYPWTQETNMKTSAYVCVSVCACVSACVCVCVCARPSFSARMRFLRCVQQIRSLTGCRTATTVLFANAQIKTEEIQKRTEATVNMALMKCFQHHLQSGPSEVQTTGCWVPGQEHRLEAKTPGVVLFAARHRTVGP